MYWDNGKDPLPEEKAEDKVQNWPSPEKVGQPNKEDKVTCHITLRLPHQTECPKAEDRDIFFPRHQVSLFQSELQHNIHSY